MEWSSATQRYGVFFTVCWQGILRNLGILWVNLTNHYSFSPGIHWFLPMQLLFQNAARLHEEETGKTITVHIPVRLHRWKDLVLQLHNQPATSVQIYLEQFAQWCTVSGCSQRAVTDTQGTGAEPGWPGAVATHQDDKIAFLETWADLSCRGRIQNKDFPSHAETHCHLWKSIISDYFQLKNSQFYVRDIVMGFFFYVSVWRRCWSFCVIKLGNA